MCHFAREEGFRREHPARNGNDRPEVILKNQSTREPTLKIPKSLQTVLPKVRRVVEACRLSVRRALGDNSRGLFLILFVLVGQLVSPGSAWSFQAHPAPEGLYAHQMAHLFFIIAMAMLAYWLQYNRFTTHRGWRLIQVSCILFLVWNLVAMTGHWVEEHIPREVLQGDPDWTQRIELGTKHLNWVYYFLKLDHLVSVPAIMCLFLGVRSLYREVVNEVPGSDD
jgi:hypothetical protein